MPRDAREIEAALLKKGFQRRQGGDAYFHLYVEGKKTPVFTKMSQGEKEIHDGLLGAMARQVKLSKRDFMQLVDCPLTAEKYLEILRQQKQIV